MLGRRVAWTVVVEHDYPSSLPEQLEGRGEPGAASAEHDDVGPANEALVRVVVRVVVSVVVVVIVIVSHVGHATLSPQDRKRSCSIRKKPTSPQKGAVVTASTDLEQLARSRLRALRQTLGYSLDELAARTNLSPSTISRVETGRRSLSLDVLVPLAGALGVDLDALLSADDDEDVVIRPSPDQTGARTTWLLSRPTSRTVALKMRLDVADRLPEQRVHPGHDWFFVLEGRVLLALGDRRIVVEAGEAAEFATMTPHSFAAVDGPAEVVMLFDRDGHRAHVHGDDVADRDASD